MRASTLSNSAWPPVWLLLASALLILAAGCSGVERGGPAGQPEPGHSTLAGAPPLGLLPALPREAPSAVPQPARSASVLTDFTVLGSLYYAKSDAAAVLGTGMELPSDLGQVQWAMYQHTGDGSPLQSLAVDYSSNTGSNVWIAVANYSSLSWEIFGPYTTSMAALDLSAAGYQSAANNLYFVAIAYDGTFITVNSSKVTYDVSAVTYSSDIEPFLSSTCTGCHHAGGASGGIALDTYADAKANAGAANTDIQADSMPPGGGLSAADQALFQAWVDGGMLE